MEYIIYYIKLYDYLIVLSLFLLLVMQIYRVVKLKHLKNNGKKIEAQILTSYITSRDKTKLEEGQDATARENNKKQIILEYSYTVEGRKKPFKRKIEIPQWLYNKIWNKPSVEISYNEKKPKRHAITALLPGKIASANLGAVLFLVLLGGVIYVAYML